jgi:dUTP pyrophosphatase
MKEDKEFPPLGYYKLHTDSQDLEFGTQGAACFDVAAYLKTGEDESKTVKGYDKNNNKIERPINMDHIGQYSSDKTNGNIHIKPKDRILIPSGLILDIPEGFSVRTHPRSSTGYKVGLHHPHDQGIVDCDYYHELFLLFYNMTEVEIVINHGQKLVQAEMIKKPIYEIKETKTQPSQKTDRIGGFGSTG